MESSIQRRLSFSLVVIYFNMSWLPGEYAIGFLLNAKGDSFISEPPLAIAILGAFLSVVLSERIHHPILANQAHMHVLAYKLMPLWVSDHPLVLLEKQAVFLLL